MAAFAEGIPLPDIQYLQKDAKEQLIESLQADEVFELGVTMVTEPDDSYEMGGKKDLVLDVDLMKPLDRIAGASVLKENGVDKIYKLEGPKAVPGTNQVLYLLRPEVRLVKFIAQQILEDLRNNVKKPYGIVFVPRKLHVCEAVLEQEGVYGNVSIRELRLDFIPLDTDIVSLELPHFFKSFHLDGDHTWCHTAARGLVTLQQMFGLIPNVYGQGKAAKIVQDLAEVIFEDVGEPNQLKTEIGHCFLLDRSADLVTPMCSQVIYEGLLDDTFTIKSGFIEFGSEITGTDQKLKLLLTSQDEVYHDIRDRHFSNVFSYLSGKAKAIQTGFDKRHTMTVQQMKDFVSNDLKDLKSQQKSLALHIGAGEVILKDKKGDFEEQLRTEHSMFDGSPITEIVSDIEEMINRQFRQTALLRLMCLFSLTHNGINPQTYKAFRTQFCHSHGFDHMVTFHRLREMGLLVEQESSQASNKLSMVTASINLPRSSQFKSLAKKLQLIPKSAEDVNLKMPNDMSYVFSGIYTPISCKLIDQVLSRQSFQGLEDITKLLPGPTVCKIKAKSAKGGSQSTKTPSSQVVLVYFLGGCTFSEIAALRFLGRQKGYRFIIATTSIINCHSLIQMSMQN